MKTRFFLATLSLLLPACQHQVKPVKERPVQIDTMQLVAPPAPLVKVASNEVYVVSRDSTTYIRFGDCYFSLDWITPDSTRNDFELHPDTLYFQLAYLRTIEAQMLAITTGETGIIQAFQCYQTSAILEKKPLRQWKHYRSPWESLTPEASNFFLCKKYTHTERTRFPLTSIHALQQYIKQHGSSTAYAHVAQLETFPSSTVPVNISTYYIRLQGDNKKATGKINKLLVIDVNFNG